MGTDAVLLRQAIEISSSSRAHGNHPFGALLADSAGAVLLRAENTVATDSDVTCHAETNLVRLASAKYSPDRLRDCSLYSSCEPCAMCAGAIYWAGIGRVVFAMSEAALLALTGSHPENPTMQLPCRVVFAGGQRETIVLGPAMTDEAAAVHHGFW